MDKKILLIAIVLVAIVALVGVFVVFGQQSSTKPNPPSGNGGVTTVPETKLALCSNSNYVTEYNHWTGKIELTAESYIKLRQELEQNGDSALIGISNLTCLQILKANELVSAFTEPISDISALGTLINLEDLSLSEHDVSDVSVLKTLKKLKSLDLFHTRVSNEDCQDLKNSLPNANITCSGLSDAAMCQLTECESDADCTAVCSPSAKCLGVMRIGSSTVPGRCSSEGSSSGNSESPPSDTMPSSITCGDGKCNIASGESCTGCAQDCNPCETQYDEEMLSFYVDMELQPLLSALETKLSHDECGDKAVLNKREYTEIAVDTYHQEQVDQLNDDNGAQVEPKWGLLKAMHSFSCGPSDPTIYRIFFVVDSASSELVSRVWSTSNKPKYDALVTDFNEGRLGT